MVYKDLDTYVAEQVARGIDARVIKEALMETGWMEADADNALRDVAARATSTSMGDPKDDFMRMRHAVNSLDERVSRLETMLAVAPEVTLPSGVAPRLETIGPERELSAPKRRMGRILFVLFLFVLFVIIGYGGMASISRDTLTPTSRIWAEAVVGIVLAFGGFVVGRMGKRGTANVLTGIGLAFGSLATVEGWYVHYIEWSVAVALGGLLMTLALVLGRFYDRWVIRRSITTRNV